MFCDKILFSYTFKISNFIKKFTYTYIDTRLGGKIDLIKYIKEVIYSSTLFLIFLFFVLAGISYLILNKNIFTISIFIFYYFTISLFLNIYIYDIIKRNNLINS